MASSLSKEAQGTTISKLFYAKRRVCETRKMR
jgi:hypothetical protein